VNYGHIHDMMETKFTVKTTVRKHKVVDHN